MKVIFLFFIVTISAFSDFNVYADIAEINYHGETVETNNSTACLDCHDDKSNNNIEPLKKGCSEGVSNSHSIGVTFPPKGKEKLFNSTKEIEDAGVLLNMSKVSCLSCHNINNNNSMHLVVENFQSKLCLICHRL